MSFKYPDLFDRHRDNELVNQRMREIHDEIKPFLKNKDSGVFAVDEVRLELEASDAAGMAEAGRAPILKVERKKEAQSYLGLLSQKSFTCRLYGLAWQNQEEIVKALTQFVKAYPKKKMRIVWDNAKFHKGALIREALRKGGTLETGAPHQFSTVWLQTKTPSNMCGIQLRARPRTSNSIHYTFSKTKEVFERFVRKRRFQYQI